jgi:hypothetical protein
MNNSSIFTNLPLNNIFLDNPFQTTSSSQDAHIKDIRRSIRKKKSRERD